MKDRTKVLVGSIAHNDWNGRRKPDKELLASIAEKGVIQPILVRPLDTPLGEPAYQVVCGTRRLMAAQALGLQYVDVLVRVLSDDEARELTLVENIQRKSLSPLEESDAVCVMLKTHKVEEVAKHIGKSRAYVAECRTISELLPAARKWMLEKCPGVPRESLAIVAGLPKGEQMKFLKERFDWDPVNILYPEKVREQFIEHTQPLGEECPFDQEDPALNQGAGRCSECPFRTATDKDLFGGIYGKRDQCTKPECFAAKRAESFGLKIAAAQKKFPEAPMVSVGYVAHPEQRTWAKEHGVRRYGEGGDFLPCKKKDRGSLPLIVAYPESKAGAIVYGKPPKAKKEDSTESASESGRLKGPEMLTARRFAWMIGVAESLIREKPLAAKWRKPEALLGLVAMYGADVEGGSRESVPPIDSLFDSVFNGMRGRIVAARLTFNRVSDIDPAETRFTLDAVLSYIDDDPKALKARLVEGAIAAIKGDAPFAG